MRDEAGGLFFSTLLGATRFPTMREWEKLTRQMTRAT